MVVKQLRGCSRFYFAEIIEDEDGKITYGTPVKVGPVKSISRTIDEASEEVWADNELQYETDGGKAVSRTFEVTNLLPEVEAKLTGQDVINISDTVKGYSTPAFANKPHFAFGYALHDGDPDNPSEVDWAFNGVVKSISKASTTIQRNETSSTGRTIEINFFSPKNKFTTTGRKNLDFYVPVTPDFDFEDWFKQVVTPDNASTVLGA